MDSLSLWRFVEDAAQKRGVSAEALRKWRERGVPHKFRLPIMQDAEKAKVKFDLRIFDAPPPSQKKSAA